MYNYNFSYLIDAHIIVEDCQVGKV